MTLTMKSLVLLVLNATGLFSTSSSSTTVMIFSSPVQLLCVQVAHPAVIL